MMEREEQKDTVETGAEEEKHAKAERDRRERERREREADEVERRCCAPHYQAIRTPALFARDTRVVAAAVLRVAAEAAVPSPSRLEDIMATATQHLFGDYVGDHAAAVAGVEEVLAVLRADGGLGEYSLGLLEEIRGRPASPRKRKWDEACGSPSHSTSSEGESEGEK